MKLKSIRIDHLWGTKNISWDLDPDVNILSGVNGMGKSTLLNCIDSLCKHNEEFFKTKEVSYSEITTVKSEEYAYFNREIEADHDRYFYHLHLSDNFLPKIQIINTFDVILDKKLNDDLKNYNIDLFDNNFSSLDINLINLQNEYLNYQVKLGKQVEVKLKEATENVSIPTIYKDVFKNKSLFINHINHLFQCTNKTVNEEENKLIFSLNDKNLTIQQLSSGEKQILIILLTALIHGDEEYVLLMDEPEISLHFDWQKQLIKMIKDLSPNCQIIIATHSPAIAMDGWLDKIVEMSTIVK